MKPTAVITGANRGIGFALTKYLLQRGSHDIFAIVRNSAAAEQLQREVATLSCHCRLEIKSANLESEVEVASLCHEIRTLEHCDLLINNAGIFEAGSLDRNEGDNSRLFAVNFTAAVKFMAAVAEQMKIRRAGNIINIGSSAGRKGLSGIGMYGATKYALVGFSESLMRELIGFDIKVTTINPAFVDTDMTRGFTAMQDKVKIQVEDIVNTVRLILSLSKGAVIPHIDIACCSVMD